MNEKELKFYETVKVLFLKDLELKTNWGRREIKDRLEMAENRALKITISSERIKKEIKII